MTALRAWWWRRGIPLAVAVVGGTAVGAAVHYGFRWLG